MTLDALLRQIKTQAESVEFQQVMETIDDNYRYQPTRFSNGKGADVVINEAGTNEGSCKIFAFAQINGLSKEETLACFGKYYREDVLRHPEGTDHANIRNFMQYGWEGIRYDGTALK